MKLINHVLNIRRLVQQAFDNRFARLGLEPGMAQAIESLGTEQQAKRRQLDGIMENHLKELGNYAEARQVSINECVFTLFNRIAAIKVMESKELFPEVIRRRKENGGRSFEHNVWLEDHPDERSAEREGLKSFLNDKFTELGEHIPLYKSDYPYALMPTADELNEIIDAFNAVEEDADCGSEVWKGDDILGWLYENFNAVEKEALKASGEKTEYNKVSLQSQVYTPQWVVKFLVDNTLGKRYLEMYPDSEIRQQYMIANAPEPNAMPVERKKVEELRVLDPACGSGNFLIYAFSLLYDLYTDQMENYGADYSRRDIPKMIVEKNLFGMDLDERAAQLSQIALFIKARELGGNRSHWPEYTNVVSTHFFLPAYEEIKDTFEIFGSWSDLQVETIGKIWNDLCSAYKFGSLVRVEERLNAMMPDDVTHSLFAVEEMENLFSYKNSIITQLHNQVKQWGGEGSNHYTLAKVNDAMSFLEMISQKYDVVVANPPYTDSSDFGSELKHFVEDNYKKPYKVNVNLYSCFIKRCCEFACEDGRVGMVNPPTFMYIKTFEDIRKYILEETFINLFVEWGYLGMFSSFARVDSAMFVLEKQNSSKNSIFIKLNDLYEMKRKDVLFSVYSDYCNGIENERVYSLPQSKLKGIKSYPFIYWISDDFREKFGGKALEDYAKNAQGMSVSNGEKYQRFFWEVDPLSIKTEVNDKKRWVFFTKGGPYNKWYGNNWLVVDWANDGFELKHDKKAVIRNPLYYFKEGLTYSSSGSKGTSFRVFAGTSLFSGGGPAVIKKEEATFDDYYLCAFLNSTLSAYMLSCLNPTVNTTQGDMNRIPFVLPKDDDKCQVSSIAKDNVNIKKQLCSFSIIEKNFEHSPIGHEEDVKCALRNFFIKENALLTIIMMNEMFINSIICSIYELSQQDYQMVDAKMGRSVGYLPVSKEAKEAFEDWIMNGNIHLQSDSIWYAINYAPLTEDVKKITDFETLYQNNNGWEEFCIKHQMNPIEVWYQFKSAGVLPPQRTQTLAFELLTDVIRTVLAKDDDGVIPLADRMGEERLALRIEQEFIARGYSAGQFSQVVQLLGCPLEKYLLERFFQQLSDHLNLFMYLPKTPFIWHLTSGPHHAIELYVSIYKWSRDTLYRVRSIYAANREAALRDRLNSIDTSNTEGRMEAAELKAQLTELAEFCEKVDDLLASGYDPKLDDGVGKNIAPLQKRKMISYEVLNTGQLKKYLNADW